MPSNTFLNENLARQLVARQGSKKVEFKSENGRKTIPTKKICTPEYCFFCRLCRLGDTYTTTQYLQRAVKTKIDEHALPLN